MGGNAFGDQETQKTDRRHGMKIDQLLKAPLYENKKWRELGRELRRVRGNGCCICKRCDKPTRVHHWCYIPGKPMDAYTINDVCLLCETCHDGLHKQLNIFRDEIFRLLTPRTFQLLNASLRVLFARHDPLVVAHALCDIAANDGLVERMAAAGFKEFDKQEAA